MTFSSKLRSEEQQHFNTQSTQSAARMSNGDANRKLQERMSRPPESWADVVMLAVIGDPALYGVLACITVVVLAIIGLLAARVMLDQIEEDEAREAKRLRMKRGEQEEEEGAEEGKKEQ